MLWFHPILQALTTLLALYVLLLGWRRFQSTSLGREAVFPWKRHVLLGKVVLLLWLGGAAGGAVMVRVFWNEWFMTHHAGNAAWMIGFILISLSTGLVMDRDKKQRTLLPLVHGGSGLIVCILALHQAWEGYWMIQHLLLQP